MTINNVSIEPGEQKVVKVHIGRLPSDTRIHINIHIFRSETPGPTMLVLAGVHGDEINGVEIVRRTIAGRFFDPLKCGSVIVIPLLNVYGFINFSREVPDGKDVNRSFPGNLNGSLASRVARSVTKKVLPFVDFGIDFHTGGRNNYNYPQVRYTAGDPASAELARAFDAPFTLANRPIAKSLRKVALKQEIPIIVYEGGENARLDGFSIEQGLMGLRRLMVAQGMLDGDLMTQTSRHFSQSTWLRAGKSGLFRWQKNSGHAIRKGEPLGVINDPYGMDEIPVIAPRSGYIIGHNNAPVVNTGDALFHIVHS